MNNYADAGSSVGSKLLRMTGVNDICRLTCTAERRHAKAWLLHAIRRLLLHSIDRLLSGHAHLLHLQGLLHHLKLLLDLDARHLGRPTKAPLLGDPCSKPVHLLINLRFSKVWAQHDVSVTV